MHPLSKSSSSLSRSLTNPALFLCLIVEKKKTGDFYAAKIVSYFLPYIAGQFRRYVAYERGKATRCFFSELLSNRRLVSDVTNCYKSQYYYLVS